MGPGGKKKNNFLNILYLALTFSFLLICQNFRKYVFNKEQEMLIIQKYDKINKVKLFLDNNFFKIIEKVIIYLNYEHNDEHSHISVKVF